MNRLDALNSIAASASRGELTFPANVDASLKLQQALADPDCHIEAAVRLVQADPLLAARTVAIANSAAYNRSGNDITNVRTAVQRLGVRTLQSVVASLIVRQLGSTITDPQLKAKADQLWEHTAHVAALSQVIARRVTRVDPDTALFAGIMHEVGGFYLLSRAGEYPGILDGDAQEWVEHGEQAVGRGVLTKLKVPEAVMQAIEALWEGLRAIPPESPADTLLLANDLAPVASPLNENPAAIAVRAKRAASSIDCLIGEHDTLSSIMAESAEEVQSLLRVLVH
ncbi:HDOD domain-containing protein [Janthinobacterium aquaticum]|uniref:HDOD domain-containing protein n=1 Tax=Janthinobacterium sp. FT58W TaxID=2654254 RepID=UPI0012654876|nr:HDOD domain-containing protein [Janthinobacterium sp. FT58W]KAB8044033.1 HDOD domain-containing protein [Janthinobacterium sp. FT58W]